MAHKASPLAPRHCLDRLKPMPECDPASSLCALAGFSALRGNWLANGRRDDAERPLQSAEIGERAHATRTNRPVLLPTCYPGCAARVQLNSRDTGESRTYGCSQSPSALVVRRAARQHHRRAAAEATDPWFLVHADGSSSQQTEAA